LLNNRITELVDDVIYNNNHNNNLYVCIFIRTGILGIIFRVRMWKEGCKKKLLRNKYFFQFLFWTFNICAYIPRYHHHHQDKYLLILREIQGCVLEQLLVNFINLKKN